MLLKISQYSELKRDSNIGVYLSVYGCWNVAKVEIFIVWFYSCHMKIYFCHICHIYVIFFIIYLYIYVLYIYMYIYMYYIYIYVLYIYKCIYIYIYIYIYVYVCICFQICFISLFSHYLILNLCDNVFIFIIWTKLL